MKFDVSRVYTAVNADELKVGSMVIPADNLHDLKIKVTGNHEPVHLQRMHDESSGFRFVADGDWALVYLVKEPPALKWTDLKVGDLVRKDSTTAMVTMINTENIIHVDINGCAICDDELEQWEKVEKCRQC